MIKVRKLSNREKLSLDNHYSGLATCEVNSCEESAIYLAIIPKIYTPLTEHRTIMRLCEEHGLPIAEQTAETAVMFEDNEDDNE